MDIPYFTGSLLLDLPLLSELGALDLIRTTGLIATTHGCSCWRTGVRRA